MSEQAIDSKATEESWDTEGYKSAAIEEIQQYRKHNSRYALHGTIGEKNGEPKVNPVSIAKNGLLADETSLKNAGAWNWNDLLPFDRYDVVYLTVDYDFAQGCIEDGFECYDIYVVVDLREIDAELYLADMRFISELIAVQYMSEMSKEDEEELAHGYAESVEEITGPETFRSVSEEKSSGSEIVVDGDVSPEAIVDIIPA